MELFPIKSTGIAPVAGKILIAEPMLIDPNFSRSVVLLASGGKDGMAGFILNHPLGAELGLLLPEWSGLRPVQVFKGGPVQTDTLHMLHRRPELLGGTEIARGYFWGGSFARLSDYWEEGAIGEDDFRVFIGYSGWSEQQLQRELSEKSWIVSEPKRIISFSIPPKDIWKNSVQSLGTAYSHLLHMPSNPQHN